MKFNLLSACFIVAAAFAMSAEEVSAQSLTRSETNDNNWRHSITPYLFLPLGTEGESTVAGTTADVDMSLDEILEVLQGAASVRYEGWKGDWGIISELYYVHIGDDGDFGVPDSNVDVDVRQTFFTLLGSYRFANGVTQSGNKYAADVSAGVRYNRLKQEIDIDLLGGRISSKLGGTEEWIEPQVGIRYSQTLNDKWAFTARADLSGFGVNDDEFQYLVLTGFDWQGWENTSLRFGYQWYGIDYETSRSDGDFAYDVDQHGLYTALSFRF